jgi:hypothetical protein
MGVQDGGYRPPSCGAGPDFPTLRFGGLGKSRNRGATSGCQTELSGVSGITFGGILRIPPNRASRPPKAQFSLFSLFSGKSQKTEVRAIRYGSCGGGGTGQRVVRDSSDRFIGYHREKCGLPQSPFFDGLPPQGFGGQTLRFGGIPQTDVSHPLPSPPSRGRFGGDGWGKQRSWKLVRNRVRNRPWERGWFGGGRPPWPLF